MICRPQYAPPFRLADDACNGFMSCDLSREVGAGSTTPSQVWLGSHHALLSGTGLASIIVVAKARGTGKKSVPRSVLEKKEDKERKKKGSKKRHFDYE